MKRRMGRIEGREGETIGSLAGEKGRRESARKIELMGRIGYRRVGSRRREGRKGWNAYSGRKGGEVRIG